MSQLLFAAELPVAQSYLAAWIHLEGEVMKAILLSLFTYFTLCVCLSVFLGGRGAYTLVPKNSTAEQRYMQAIHIKKWWFAVVLHSLLFCSSRQIDDSSVC